MPGPDIMTRPNALIMDAHHVESLPATPLDGEHGVTFKTLWTDASHRSFAGLMHLAPGASVRMHTHRYAIHHMWIVEGECVVDDRVLSRGAYSFVPAAARHGIEYAGLFGCTVLYVFERAAID